MFSAIFSFFATAGSFLVNCGFVISSTAALAICFAILACQILLWFPLKQSFVNGSCFWGGLTGFVWSIAAIWYVGLGSAFLSVLAVCALLLFIAWATWMAREYKGYSIPDWA